MRLENSVIAITGAGGGIGRQLVLESLRRGARVAAADVRQEALDETASLADAGDRLMTAAMDVTNRDAVGALPARIERTFGQVDGYISNAGIIQPFVRLNELDHGTIERVINVNLFGAINMAKAFLPTLLSRPQAHLVNLSSMGGFLPVPGQTIYGAAKAAVKLLSEGLYAELLDTNVGVSVVMPGAVATDIATNSGVDVAMEMDPEQASRRTTSAEDAASIILDGMENDDLHIYVGRDSKVMKLLTTLSPRRATHFISTQMKDLLGE